MMDDQTKPASCKSHTRWIATAVVRSMVSTAIIAIVAVGVFVFREGYLSLRIFRDVVVENGPFFVALFLGLVMWNLWFR
jgi:hypothetical protein